MSADEIVSSVVRMDSESKRRGFRPAGRIHRWPRSVRANGRGAWIGLVCSLQFGLGPAEATPDAIRCSCLEVEGLADATASAGAVFIGVARSSAEVAGPATEREIPNAPQRLVEFTVLGSWKGPTDAIAEVRTGLSDADCGFPFEMETAYLVFARGEPDDLSVSLCSRTALIGDALHDLIELGVPADVGGGQ